MTDITELTSVQKNANIHRLSRLIAYTSNDELRQMAVEVEHYTDQLIEALEKAQGMEAYWKTQCRGITDHCEELQARIAELEREQEHLRPVGVMSEQAFHRLENRECRFIALWPRPGIFLPRKRPEDGVIVYARTAAAAGIKVEADSLDADVSNRNQPGMVVAVHIDVGDFVKFRGRVYEVKETDFDDHDVTLWFVCGEVLKCAAGCPIEVVSAPVEDE
ncbi:hypothetical protein ACT5HB_000084 [Klebsiella pneumoniae]